MNLNDYEIIVASNVSEGNDGIGIEVWEKNELIILIFRDDTKKTRTVRTFNQNVSLELMEKIIEIFKNKIPWEFIEYDKTD
ncbi:hypothetical protein [Winogradskyella sp. SM1960]|uniref:hypothetical protein n=1 Tax=Winogradskyella sp. SM1960 TaxID=2865955 RepID=UPI001CD48876|nr:hypothetical protein [Winogradskyella sp. SM1960]